MSEFGLLTALGLLACLLLELFQLLLIVSLNVQLHPSQVDLVFVLGASDFVLKLGAVVAPLKKFEFVDKRLALDVFHLVDIFSHFRDRYSASLQFLIGRRL